MFVVIIMLVVMTVITDVVKHLNVVKSLKCASALVYDDVGSFQRPQSRVSAAGGFIRAPTVFENAPLQEERRTF